MGKYFRNNLMTRSYTSLLYFSSLVSFICEQHIILAFLKHWHGNALLFYVYV